MNPIRRNFRSSLHRAPILIAERPHWTIALKRLTSPQQWRCCLIPEQPAQADYLEDFLDKGKANRLSNSSTTCDISDDESEVSIEVGGRGWFTESTSSARGETSGHVRSNTSINGLNQSKRRSSKSRSKAGNRPRLGSSSSLSLKAPDSPRRRSSASRPRLDSSCSSINTVDSLHRRSDANELPTLDDIGLKAPDSPRRRSSASRPRLDSSCSSINTVDSLHRRSDANELPKLDDIWNKPMMIQTPVPQAAPVPSVKVRPSLYHNRAISVGTQISAITLEDHEHEGKDELCFDLSISEKEDELTIQEVVEKSPPLSENKPTDKTHERHVSFCSVTTEGSSSPTSVVHQEACKGADSDGSIEVIPYVPDITASRLRKEVGEGKKEVQSGLRPPPSPNTKRWVRKNNHKGLKDHEPSQAENPPKHGAPGPRQSNARATSHACEYLPIHPVPRLSLFSAKATVLSAGWAAVFWESPIAKLPTRYSIEVPKMGPENLFYIQLLTGGMLQLTPLVDAEQKMILMTPKSVSPHGDKGDSWRVPLVSRRAGHCLVMEAMASTIKDKEHNIYILPVNIPSERLTQLSHETHENIGDTSIEEDIFFAPFGPGGGTDSVDGESPQPYAPYHQHDAVMHLRFAMEAALSMDAALRFGGAARR